jgi:putative peptide zinc metalloprotease protein
VVVFSGIILFVADKFLLAGLLMALICVVSWGLAPLFRLIKYLAASPRLARTRVRAAVVCVGFFVLVGSFFAFCPFPNRFRAPGVIETIRYVRVVNDAPGYVRNIRASSGTEVRPGTPLIELSDRELDLEIEATLAQRSETRAMELKALRTQAADLQPLRKRLETVESKLRNLDAQRGALVVRARDSGIWVAPAIQELVGTWIHRGAVIGQIVNRGGFRFSAVVSQDEAADLFTGRISGAEVRIYGEGGKNLEVSEYQIIPFRQEKLPSAALGWRGGGEVAVSVNDQTGRQAAEPFFQIYADIPSDQGAVLLHGRSGKLRFTLDPKPLFSQWAHLFRQFLQKRYQL